MDGGNIAAGRLRVRVSTAGDSIPVEGAVVYVRLLGAPGDDRLIYSLRTDGSGQTATVTLPVPGDAAGDRDPEPAGFFSVKIMKEGYRDAEYSSVPVYAGVTSLIEAELVPVSEEDRLSDVPPKAEIFPGQREPSLFGEGGGM